MKENVIYGHALFIGKMKNAHNIFITKTENQKSL